MLKGRTAVWYNWGMEEKKMQLELVTEQVVKFNGKRVPAKVEARIFELMEGFKASRVNGANSPVSDKAAFGMARVAIETSLVTAAINRLLENPCRGKCGH